MEAGQYNETIDIFTRVPVRDAYGSDRIYYGHSQSVRANVKVIGGSSVVIADAVQYVYQLSIYARMYANVTDVDVIRYGGNYYAIDSIIVNRLEQRKEIKAHKVDSSIIALYERNKAPAAKD